MRILTAKRRRVLGIGAALAVGLVGLIYAAFSADMREHDRRLAGRSELIETTAGTLEYAERGYGPPFLMIHGTGGGFDQALTFTRSLDGFRIIAPSRFGYLRSNFPAEPLSEYQADALRELLDHLRLDKVAVAGGSAGALSAVQFALRYPERTSALVLIVPAANVRGRDPVEMGAAAKAMVRGLSSSDFLFWSASKVARHRMIATLLATDPALVERAPECEQRRVNRILDEIMPVSRRWRGMLNDARLAGNPAQVDFTELAVPTLVISVEDDRFGTAATAREIAAAVSRAELLVFPKGGHVWVGHNRELWRAVRGFLAQQRAAVTER